MSEAPVEAIRKSSRYDLTIHRKKLKDGQTDIRRSIAELNLKEIDIKTLASNLKQKSLVTASDLNCLKNCLIQDMKNIELVMNTEGALRGLVRELTGSDVNKQVAACGCLCNLALGDSRACVAVAKAAAAYLVAALDSQTLELALTCAWTLGNLCGAGPAATQLVASSGAVAKLCAQMSGEEERMDAAVYALTLYAHGSGEQLSKEHLEMIIKKVAPSACKTDMRLFFILSCHKDFADPDELVANKIITRFDDLMEHHLTLCIGDDCCDIIHAIRTLANMETGNTYFIFLTFIRSNDERKEKFKKLANEGSLKKSLLWLYGNMMCRQDHRLFIEKFDHRTAVPVMDSERGDEIDGVLAEEVVVEEPSDE